MTTTTPEHDNDAAEETSPAVVQEVEAEELPDGYVRVPLGETSVRAIVPNRWRASHLRALNKGDFDLLIVGGTDPATGRERPGVLHEDDVDVWDDIDPTQDEIIAWLNELSAHGEPLGKSGGQPGSSRRMRRR